jgi:hypothetical protein
VFCWCHSVVVIANDDFGPQAVVIAVVVAMMMTMTMLISIASSFDEDVLVFTRETKSYLLW